MNRKKHRRIISLLLLLLVSASFLSPTRVNGEATVREILKGIGELTPIDNTPYLLAKEVKGTKYGVFNTDGEQLIPYAYADLYYIASNCFCAAEILPAKKPANKRAPLEEINSNALVTADGTRVSDFQYGSFQVLNTYWACGFVWEESGEEDADFTAKDGSFYRIQRSDYFYLGDHALVGKMGTEELHSPLSLSRDESKDAKGHGKYLYVQDNEDQITIYDGSFQRIDAEVKKLDDPVYVIKNFAVMIRGTSDILLDGFTEVKEEQTDAGMLLRVTRLDYSANKWVAVYTVEGKELMPLFKGEIVSATKDYAVLNSEGKKGLYSFREKKLIVPCDFDKVVACKTTLDPYLLHGYVGVEKEGKSYYYRVADGQLFESVSPGNKWRKFGAAYTLNDGQKSKYRIMAPDQVSVDVDDSKLATKLARTRGSGYLLALYHRSYKHMIVTWRGEIVMKFYNNAFVITDDDKVIVTKKDGTCSLIEIQ